MHLQAKRITPESWDTTGVLFDIHFLKAPMPGTVWVCKYPARLQTAGGILLEGQEAAHGSKYQPDYGVVAAAGDGVPLERGQIVQLKPYDGIEFNHRDYDWIPEGRILAMYGRVAGDHWGDSVEAVYEPQEDK